MPWLLSIKIVNLFIFYLSFYKSTIIDELMTHLYIISFFVLVKIISKKNNNNSRLLFS